MTNTEKVYIGKGKANKYGIRLNINLSKAGDFIHQGKTGDYLSFFVNELREADKYGNTHTVYCLPRQEPVEAEETEE